MTANAGRPKVLYVLGTQRGGSTIIGRVIGAQPGFAFGGEVRRLWARGTGPGRTCGCGRTFAVCPMWSQVLPRVLVDGVDAPQVAAWQEEVASPSHSWRHAERILRAQAPGADPWPALVHYREAMGRMYSGMAATLGARVLVDASKLPADAAVLLGIGDVDPYVLQLVRDPRGVVHSQLQRRARRGPAGWARTGYLAASWGARHAAARRLAARSPGVPWLRMTYEEFVTGPVDALAQIAEVVGEPVSPLPASSVWDLAEVHTPGGALPARSGVALERDSRWESSLPAIERAVVTAATLPWLLRFGYPIGRPTTADPRGPRRPRQGEASA